MAVRIATGAVAHIGGSEGFAIGCRSRHNFPRNVGRRFLPYKAMNLFPGRVLGSLTRYRMLNGLRASGRLPVCILPDLGFCTVRPLYLLYMTWGLTKPYLVDAVGPGKTGIDFW
ncbi:hypothetical protein EVAR_65308_1 [Eumeta japonica]|uniref:Uncharacterized protein n=1 Tax=Eumeta variegata TaxID=151549 RepID=A0A4C1YVX8_EUMVA|nr:hypothetical protein EVAR_65308_1 [Eumeta japonica]